MASKGPGNQDIWHYTRGTNSCEFANKYLEDVLSAPRCSPATTQSFLRIFTSGYNLRAGSRRLGQPEVAVSDLKLVCEVR